MSNLVLYRRYRPLRFADVVNQEHIKTTLQNAVTGGRIGHAYLFVGPRGVGKTTLARIFARAINCPARQGAEPCNDCEVCRGFLAGTSLDLLEIDAASHTGVDNIRELIDHLQFAPTQATYKVIIIDEVHMLSKGAFNALLKTLEEPPKHAVFILATTEAHKIPATIISRTQRFDFKKVSISDLAKLLKFVIEDNKLKASEAALMEVSRAADGSFRDGLSLLDQVISFADGEITEELVEEVLGLTGTKTLSQFTDLLLAHDATAAVGLINDLVYAGRDIYQFGKDFLEYLRKLLLVKVGVSIELGLEDSFKEKLLQQAQSLTNPELVRVIEIFQKAESEMKWSSIQSLPLELAAAAVCEVPVKPIEQISRQKPSGAPVPAANHSNQAATPSEPVPRVADGSTLDTVMAHWPQILEKMKDYNHSLISSLKLAKPVSLVGRELVVAFPYKFHKDAIEARKNRIIVDQVIEEVCGVKLFIKPVMEKDWQGMASPASSDTRSPLVNSALNILGGEVETP